MPRRTSIFVLFCLLVAGGTVFTRGAEAPAGSPSDAFALCRSIGRGINLGNGLEAPSEGAWGYKIEDDHLRLIKQGGFDSVRIPIKWSARAAKEAPYPIEAMFFERVDHILDEA